MAETGEFSRPEILAAAKEIIKGRRLCFNCLGRQFAHISTGMTNRERGIIIGRLLGSDEPDKCSVCNSLFKGLEKYANEAMRKTGGIEFHSFLVGSRLSSELMKTEESLWEEHGIEFVEPIKSEINRELGKLIHKKSRKKVDEKNPDILIMLDLQKGGIELIVKPLYFYGKYKKLVRGIPQTKWYMYKVTVEDIIAKPFIKASAGSGHSMHAQGREDIDARCLDWRPFVIEINNPKSRRLDIKIIEKEINRSKKVVVSGMRKSDRAEVVKVKNRNTDKTYRALAIFEKAIDKKQIGIKMRTLVGKIRQQTPDRVLHRRTDKMRVKRVKSIKYKILGSKKMEIIIRGEAGLYIKELITGDNGRTRPSVSGALNNPAKVKELDVIKIHSR